MRRRGKAQTKSDGERGFVAADALVALTAAAMLLALVTNATSTGLKSARLGWERRLATAEAEYRLHTIWPAMRTPGERSGAVSGGGAWRVAAAQNAADPNGVALCEVTSEASTGAPPRTVRLRTVRFCTASAR